MKHLLVFSLLLLAGCLEANHCVPRRCPKDEVFTCCPTCPQTACIPQDIQCTKVCWPGCVCRNGYLPATTRATVMNWTIVLLFAAGCGICAAQTTVKSPATTTSVPSLKGFIPLAPGAKCPITTCGRNQVLQTCGLCYDNTCAGLLEICKRVCYCGCYCKRGLVRVTKNGPCILPKQCPRLLTV
uniref:TIL domain-containing protein n=1 Tax=Anopheles christyi TaxID=43041 RepID=A0A182K813_9DIPT